MGALHWTYKSFDELTNRELYAIMQLRIEIFSVEQNCVYQDADNKDFQSFHLSAWDNDKLVAYCRILPPQLAFTEASIGRVITAAAYRKNGTGRNLMLRAIAATLQQFNCNQITIGAQLYLKKFYESLGFTQISETYLEDGIPHIEMRYTA
jgi:ElaA protein